MVLWSLAPVLRAGVKRTGTDFYGLVRTPAAEFSAAAIRIDTRSLGWVVQRCLQVRAGLVGVVSPAIARVALFGLTCQTGRTGRTGRKELPA